MNVHLITLGCARNRVDSEVMLGSLLEKGWKITDDPKSADTIVINTCGFIDKAKEESVDTILQATELKKENPSLKVVVSGCLTQRYKTQLAKALPEVDLFVGTDEFARLPELLSEPQRQGAIFAKRTNYIYSETLPRVNTLSKSSAFVKIAEGCQHNCSFCIIPAIRGRLRSRPIESVVSEVKNLVANGVKEFNLIAQDLAAYGREKGHDELLPLLQELVKINGVEWIRLLYMYPENISDAFLDFFANEKKLVKYLDIPVQHGSDSILKSMNRNITQKELRNIITQVRNRVENMVIRTTVMVGYPGETEEDFLELYQFIKDIKFDHLGCFKFSKEEGTVAGRLPNQVDEEIKDERYHRLMSLQKIISNEKMQKYKNQTLDVLIQGVSQESEWLWEGRAAFQAPEVDGLIYINEGEPKPHTIQKVLVTDTFDYDLVGKII